MAATQAEKQQNDVNSEKVQSDQHLNVRNTLLQNGTDKSGVRGGGSVVVTKAKATGTMSQYRQDGSSEQGLSDSEMGPTGSEAGLYPPAPGAPSEGPPVGDGHGYGFPFGSRDMHNSGDGSLHGFAARQGFGAPKQPPTAFSQQQRFVSGQTISQPTGPTPTLNQLLQSSNPMHRYQNSYGHPDQPYSQGWPPQKPLAPYSSATVPGSAPGGPVYRNQSTVSKIACCTAHLDTYQNFHERGYKQP